jgi:serine/threonine protein kinase
VRRSNDTVPFEAKQQQATSQLGDYRVIGPLSRGGTAAVYLGEHVVTGERFAIKLLDAYHANHPDLVVRMLAEYDVAKSTRHAGLLEIHAAGRSDDNLPFLVMELLDGENLGELADRGPIQLDAVLAIGAQIASAIAALHAVGYAHCDIKADNVFVLYSTTLAGWPCVKVIDYGVARHTSTPESDTTIAGTPSYMAPEQWRGAPVLKSDVYGLGCLLYELVTGDHPFHGTLPQLMLAHCQQLAERPSMLRSDVPMELDRLITRMMSKDSAMRPSMHEVEIELVHLLRDRVDQPATLAG